MLCCGKCRYINVMVTYTILVEWTWESLFFSTHKTYRGRFGGAPSPKCFPNVSSSRTVQQNREDGRTEIQGNDYQPRDFLQVPKRPAERWHSEGFVTIYLYVGVQDLDFLLGCRIYSYIYIHDIIILYCVHTWGYLL